MSLHVTTMLALSLLCPDYGVNLDNNNYDWFDPTRNIVRDRTSHVLPYEDLEVNDLEDDDGEMIKLEKLDDDQCDGVDVEGYEKLRNELIKQEEINSFGAHLSLTYDEKVANECLMTEKYKEVNEGFKNPSKFLPSQNFAKVRRKIEKSDVFKIIRKMPKGAVFHAHSTAITSLDYIIKNMFNEPNLYVCLDDNKKRFRVIENDSAPGCNEWQLVKKLRKMKIFTEESMRKYLHSLSDNFTKDLSIDKIWSNFEEMFSILKGVLLYRPNFEKFFYEALQEFYDDNIMYVEIRSSLSKIYEINGTKHDPMFTIQLYKKIIDKFVQDHPGFLGAKIIYSVKRKGSIKSFEDHVKIYKEIHALYPDFVVGFDLVGQEDKGEPLNHFIALLLGLGKDTQFFFHAGETNWYGHPTDENLFDAVLLNTKRIGHGFALLKHPILMDMVKRKNITIEINPISNQLLKLVEDMRNHPASYFFAENFPLVVSNDDPSLWGAKGLSYDFYEAFMGIMSRHADLKALKQLAINSIVYSAMNSEEQKEAFSVWEKAWLKFVKNLANDCPKFDENVIE